MPDWLVIELVAVLLITNFTGLAFTVRRLRRLTPVTKRARRQTVIDRLRPTLRRLPILEFVVLVLLLGICVRQDPDTAPLAFAAFCLLCGTVAHVYHRSRRRFRLNWELTTITFTSLNGDRRAEIHRASERAEALFERLLTPEQRRQYRRTGFIVAAIYQDKPIVLGFAGLVCHGTETYCVAPEGGLVLGDNRVAQLLAARTDPASLIKAGRRTGLVAILPTMDGYVSF